VEVAVATATELYQLGSAHYHAGRAAEAEQALRAALAQEPAHGGALHLLGALAYQAGRAAEAAGLLRRAAEALPHDAACRSLLGAALHALGRLDEALATHREALRLAPGDGLALNNFGTTLAAAGRTEEAAAAFERALAASPNDPGALCNLAAVRHRQGRAAEAAELYREALRLRPDLAEAHNNLGNLLRDQGRPAEAEAAYRRAAELRPGFALAHANLARLLQQRGRPAEAVAACRRALELAPGDAGLHARLGQALLALNRAAEALACCREAVRLAPADPDARNDLGNALVALGELGEADAAYAEATRLRPGWSAPVYNRGLALQGQGRLEEGRACFAEALRLAPEDRVAHSTFVGTLHYEFGATPEALLAEARRWAERHAPAAGPPPGFANVPDPGRRLRVGYVSPDFRRHAVAFFLEPILAHHDPEQVEVFCYSGVAAPDDRTAALRRLATHWRDTAGLSDEELAALARADGIDVLVDLAGHLEGGRLPAFAGRPAPVQVSYLGYPGTTGLPAVGYRLTDGVADPPGEPPGHSEELVRLPGCFCCYAPPELLPIDPAPPSRREGAVTFGALHKLEKLNSEVLDLWSRLLREVPGSRLLLARNTLHGPAAERLRGEFARRGVGAERLLLERADAAWMRHLALYNRVDVALDAFPWCGHTTACEALWMGVPVVTLRGRRHAGRMTASVLTCLGLTELIAETPDDYLRRAAALAGDEARRGGWRAGLREALHASALCDGPSFTRGLEAAYRGLWRRWCERAGRDDGPATALPPAEAAHRPATRPPGDSMPCGRRYLIGPASEEWLANWEGPRRQGWCRAFGAAGGVDLAVGPADTWEDVCRRLPPGWRPDFVALHLNYTTVPAGLWSAPVPLVGLAADWNLQWHHLRRVLPRLDLVLTDAPGVEALRRAGCGHARAANLYGLEPPWRGLDPDEGARDIDVLFVGNLHPAVQRERLPWLARLARLGERWRVVIATGTHGADYRALLCRARVAFNRSVRGECNRRAVEAAAAGALLFLEADNAEAPAYFAPGREYVAYSDGNLERLLEHYLTHEGERRAVARAARERVQGHAFEALWGREGLAAVGAEWPALVGRAGRRPAWGGDEALLARTWQALGACDGGDPALAADLAAAAAARPGSAALHNALGLAEALAGPGGRAGAPAAERAARHFHRALAADPRHAVAALNLVEALAEMGEGGLAAEGARRALALLERGAGLTPEALDAPHYPPAFDHFRVEWERAAWQSAGDPAAERAAKRDLLRWRLHALLAGLTGDLGHHREAALARPDLPPAQAALGLALARAGRPAEAAAHLRRAVAADPFDAGAARALHQALREGGDAAAAAALARERRLLARAAPRAVAAEPWFADNSPAPPPAPAAAGVVWEGAHRALHSLGLVCREVCRRLIARGHDVGLLATGQRDAPVEADPAFAPLAARLGRRTAGPCAAHVRLEWPPNWQAPPEGHWVLFQPWEFGSLPRDWLGPLTEQVDEAWVPSRFVRDCFVQSGVPAEHVFVVPLGADTARFRPGAPPLPLRTRKRFKFLFVGGTIHRKGFDLLLGAYARAFSAADDVCLVIKDMGVGTFYRGQTAEALVARLREAPGAPEVEYIDRALGAEEMAGLYAACDCLAAPYRGEGFGLPIAEAMASGLPVVVTGCGPALDLCDEGTAWLLPARPVRFPERRVGELETVDYPWLAEPDAAALAAALRRAFENPEEGRAKGAAGRARACARFTWEHAADAVERRLAALRGRPVRRFGRPASGAAAPAAVAPAVAVPGLRPKVSLCMIVRNEEENLPACLGSAADLADEVVVVDTGSADRTKEVAARFGAKVFDFPWCDSFAAARNESLRHASGEWVFWLDADDRLDEDNRARLRALFAALGGENAAYSMKCLCLPDASGTATVVDHVRLFRNLPGVRWEFRVHEQILPSVRRCGGQVRWSDVVIRHAGYQDPALRRRKLDRDLRLLRLEDEEHPGQPFTLFNLGSVYQELGRHAEAIPLLRRSLGLSRPADSIVRKLYALLAGCHRALGQTEEALAACREGLGVCPGDPELLFVQALLLQERGDPAGAESCLLALLSTEPGPHFASTDAGLRGYKARHNLAILYRRSGRHGEAEAQWRLAVRERPDFLPAWLGLGEGHLRRAEWGQLEEVARRMEGLPEGGVEAAVLRGRAWLARKEFGAARAALEEAVARWPQVLGPRVFLSYALLQGGTDPTAAERALLAVLELDPTNAEARHNLALLRRERGPATQGEACIGHAAS
jgi:predicted O-linked N-acetylglucosamine transferase (SPINDLY family)/glycosyltransferase involved in cell wall biosynthesis